MFFSPSLCFVVVVDPFIDRMPSAHKKGERQKYTLHEPRVRLRRIATEQQGRERWLAHAAPHHASHSGRGVVEKGGWKTKTRGRTEEGFPYPGSFRVVRPVQGGTVHVPTGTWRGTVL